MKDYSDLVQEKIAEWYNQSLASNGMPKVIVMNTKDVKRWIRHLKCTIANFENIKTSEKMWYTGIEVIRSKDLKKGEIRIY